MHGKSQGIDDVFAESMVWVSLNLLELTLA